MGKPDIRNVEDVVAMALVCSRMIGDRYVPARGEGPNQLRFFGRFKAAWLVFTGRADAVTYPGQ